MENRTAIICQAYKDRDLTKGKLCSFVWTDAPQMRKAAAH